MRELDAPDEPDRRGDRHGRVDEHGHPRGRRVHVQDPEPVTLLVIGGREHQSAVQADHDQHEGGPAEPRR